MRDDTITNPFARPPATRNRDDDETSVENRSTDSAFRESSRWFFFLFSSQHAYLKIQNTHKLTRTYEQPSQKSFRTKTKLAKAARQNRPVPNWIRYRTGNTIKYNAKRRHWRRTKLGL